MNAKAYNQTIVSAQRAMESGMQAALRFELAQKVGLDEATRLVGDMSETRH